MKYYVTFGQAHNHIIDGVVFNGDCVAVINAGSYNRAVDKAQEFFGLKYCLVYGRLEDVNIEYYPRGLIPVKSV